MCYTRTLRRKVWHLRGAKFLNSITFLILLSPASSRYKPLPVQFISLFFFIHSNLLVISKYFFRTNPTNSPKCISFSTLGTFNSTLIPFGNKTLNLNTLFGIPISLSSSSLIASFLFLGFVTTIALSMPPLCKTETITTTTTTTQFQYYFYFHFKQNRNLQVDFRSKRLFENRT